MRIYIDFSYKVVYSSIKVEVKSARGFVQRNLVKVLGQENIQITFPDLNINAAEIVTCTCYQTLQAIKLVLEDEQLTDRKCFMQIEKIVGIFEDIGSECGFRHDF
jgi:hypothetical protein